MRKDLAGYPEIKKSQVNLGGGMSAMGGETMLDYEIYGYSFEETDSVAAQLSALLRDIKGVSEVRISRADYQPEYQVDFDREKLALNGLNLATAATYLRNRINGATASQFREEGEEYDIKVMYAPEYRTSIEDIENIVVYNAQGKGVRVKELGTVVERFAPPTIDRKDRERINTVSAILSGAAMSEVVAAAQEKIDQMSLPSGISIQLSGTYEDQQDSFGDFDVSHRDFSVHCNGCPIRVIDLSVYHYVLVAFCILWCVLGPVVIGQYVECDVVDRCDNAYWYCGEKWYRAYRLYIVEPGKRYGNT